MSNTIIAADLSTLMPRFCSSFERYYCKIREKALCTISFLLCLPKLLTNGRCKESEFIFAASYYTFLVASSSWKFIGIKDIFIY